MAKNTKPILKVKTKQFVEFMFTTADGSDGYDVNDGGVVEKALVKNGKFVLTLEDMSNCGYIPKRAIGNIREIPDDLWMNEDKDEVNPEDFKIVFVK